MEGSDKRAPSPNPPNSSSRSNRSSTGSGENNENHLSRDQLKPYLQNHGRLIEKHFMSSTISASSTGENNENHLSRDQLKPYLQNHGRLIEKHFMSSTISASSKAVPPRNRILVERNENSSCSKSQIDITPESLNDTFPSHVGFSYNQAFESDYDGNSNSCLMPYDPLTNYLSPRPKYLRFNPIRRSELLSRLEKEYIEEFDGEEESSEGCVKDSMFTQSKETDLEIQKSSPEEDMKENYDTEEKKDDTENEDVVDIFSEEEEEIEGGRRVCGLRGLLKFLITFTVCLFFTSYICPMDSTMPPAVKQVTWDLNDSYLMIQNNTYKVIHEKLDDFLVTGDGDSYHAVDEERTLEYYVEDNMLQNEGHSEENFDSATQYSIASHTDEAAEIELVGNGDFVLEADKFVQLICTKTFGDMGANGTKHEDVEDKVKAVEQNEVIGDGKSEQVETNRGEDLEDFIESFEEEPFGNDHDYIADEFDEVVESDELEAEADSSSQHIVGKETNESGDDGFEDDEDRWKFIGAIGLSIIVSIISLASLVLLHYLKKVRTIPGEQSQPAFTIDEEEIESSPSLSSPLMENIDAPSVELIREIFVGERSKSKSTLGGSRVTVSLKKQATSSDFSSTTSDLDSDGSFSNARNKNFKKKEQKGGKSGNASIF